MIPVCIFGVAGYSGSGKTTLIRKILPQLRKQGLSVGVLKHVHHALNPDTRGKDTDLFFRAGADFVFAHDAQQAFARFRGARENLFCAIGQYAPPLDLIIVEGHKDIDLPGVWLEAAGAEKRSGRKVPGRRTAIAGDDRECERKVIDLIHREMARHCAARPLFAGLLVGGKSRRMGMPKSLLKMNGRTLASRSFVTLSSVAEDTVLIGSGVLPGSLRSAARLPDVSGLNGPLAGMLSAFRWAPGSAWIISSVDMPLMCVEAWKWLLDQRRPGVWAVLPKIKGSRGVETTGAVYEPMIFEYVESLAGEGNMKLQELASHPKVKTPIIPESLSHAWENVNSPAEWKRICSRLGVISGGINNSC